MTIQDAPVIPTTLHSLAHSNSLMVQSSSEMRFHWSVKDSGQPIRQPDRDAFKVFGVFEPVPRQLP